MFDEVHGDQIPWLLQDQELLQSSIWLMAQRLGSPASRTRLAVVLDEPTNTGPRILASEELESLVKAVVTCEGVVVLVTENSEPEFGNVGDVDAIIEKE